MMMRWPCGEILLQAVKTHDAQLGRRDEYGQRYSVDFPFEWQAKRAMIRSGWIIERGFVTPSYPLR
jgi:hypothetical protein